MASIIVLFAQSDFDFNHTNDFSFLVILTDNYNKIDSL